jgi:hypothetical protein
MLVEDETFNKSLIFIMGINVTPIFTKIYMVLLENELKDKCKRDPKLIWPILVQRSKEDEAWCLYRFS